MDSKAWLAEHDLVLGFRTVLAMGMLLGNGMDAQAQGIAVMLFNSELLRGVSKVHDVLIQRVLCLALATMVH